jgi:hypothetical protein
MTTEEFLAAQLKKWTGYSMTLGTPSEVDWLKSDDFFCGEFESEKENSDELEQ